LLRGKHLRAEGPTHKALAAKAKQLSAQRKTKAEWFREEKRLAIPDRFRLVSWLAAGKGEHPLGERIPGPTCQVKNWFSDQIDPGTAALMTHRPPTIVGHTKHHHHHHRRPQKITVRVLPIHEEKTIAFLHSVARSKVLAHHITAQWKPAKDPARKEEASRAERFLFWLASKAAGTDQEPGILTISMGDESRINDETNAETKSLVTAFHERLSRGPKSLHSFMEEQQRARARNLVTIEAVYDEVKQINKEFRANLTDFGRTLVEIKCSAIIGFKTVGFIEERMLAFFINIGADVAISVISEWQDAEAADAIANAGREAEVDAWQKISENATEHGLKQVAAAVNARIAKGLVQTGDQALADLYSSLLKNTEDTVVRGLLRRSLVFPRVMRSARIGAAISRGLGKGIKRGVSALWLAKDVYMAVQQARDEYSKME
jgi:hypothetical protein